MARIFWTFVTFALSEKRKLLTCGKYFVTVTTNLIKEQTYKKSRRWMACVVTRMTDIKNVKQYIPQIPCPNSESVCSLFSYISAWTTVKSAPQVPWITKSKSLGRTGFRLLGCLRKYSSWNYKLIRFGSWKNPKKHYLSDYYTPHNKHRLKSNRPRRKLRKISSLKETSSERQTVGQGTKEKLSNRIFNLKKQPSERSLGSVNFANGKKIFQT